MYYLVFQNIEKLNFNLQLKLSHFNCKKSNKPNKWKVQKNMRRRGTTWFQVSADYVCKIIIKKKNTLSILSLYKSLNDSEVIFNILLMKWNSFNFT